MEIDPRFKAARQHAAKRRSRNLTVAVSLWGGAGFAVAVLGLGFYFSGLVQFGSPEDPEVTEADEVSDPVGSYATAFVDLAGDPMLLRFDLGSGAEKSSTLLRPMDLPADRAGNDLVLLRDEMITGQERLITTIPSSREDFAFFQAQRQAPPTPVNTAQAEVASGPKDTVIVAEGDDSSWGESLPGENAAAPDTYTASKIEDSTSLSFVLPEARRTQPYEDVVVRLKEQADLMTQLTLAGVTAPEAKRVAEAAILIIPEAAALGPAHVLALRLALRDGVKVLVQMSLYSGTAYFGTVATNDLGELVAAVDPWVEEDLFNYAGEDVAADADNSRKYRLLDAFYSAAIRNGVPSAVVAETIVMISQAHDLEAFVNPGDQMVLLYARDAGSEGPGAGQVLYASIKGEGRVMECYVFKATGKEDYGCFGAPGTGGTGAGSGGVGLRAGLVAPVQGVMTSRFGPRMHPILKVAKLHKGVDWAAPVGTPVTAAFDGVIAAAGDGKGYGNLVRINHAGGLETRYAHLNAFADGIKAGVTVAAGTLVGYVGTTGQSTGPHLHFELYEAGVAVDPLGAGGGTQVASDGSAVEKLVDQIIRVESGGNATAKNKLSSATGLGQFISSTWLRMMQQYRPDLASSMSKEELLALRFDPTISREMVTALAREGESYLRSRGHEITAGRLYLCHFLGMEGANKLLSADDSMMAVDILGIGVQNANPTIITNQTAAQVEAWAERKMSGKGGASLPAVAAVSAEVLAYQKIIASLVGSPT